MGSSDRVGLLFASIPSTARRLTINKCIRHCVKTLSGHSEWVRGIVPAPDGRHIISCSTDQTARVWDVTTGENKMDLRGHEHVVEVAVFAPAIAGAAIRELAGLVRHQIVRY